MRRLGCVVLAFAFVPAACSKPGGVELLVTAPAGLELDEVRLFVGPTSVGSVPSLAIPGDLGSGSNAIIETPLVAGRDGGDIPPETVMWQSGGVNIELQSAGSDTLAAAIVVGYKTGAPVAAASVTNLAMNAHEVDRYEVPLQAISANAELYLWGPDTTTLPVNAVCAGFVGTAANPGGSGAAFIVPSDDFDCDGFANTSALECNEYVYKQTGGPGSIAHDSCFKLLDNGTDCRLGAETCTDGSGYIGGCSLPDDPICLAVDDCLCPQGSGETALQCLVRTNGTDINQKLFGYSCGVAITDACTSYVLTQPPTGGLPCIGSASGFAGSNDEIDSDLTIDGVSYHVAVADSCAITVTPSGSMGNTTPSSALLWLTLINNHVLILPVSLSIAEADAGSACSGTCGYDPNLDQTPLTSCLAQWTSVAPVMLDDIDTTQLFAHSPTLDEGMTELFTIGSFALAGSSTPTSGVIIEWKQNGSGFGLGSAILSPIGMSFESIHLRSDGSALYALTGSGTIIVYDHGAGDTWTSAGGTFDITPDGADVAWFAPDEGPIGATGAQPWDDFVDANKNSSLSEGSSVFQTAIPIPQQGLTPWLSYDDLALYFATQGPMSQIAVTTRAQPSDRFSGLPVIPPVAFTATLPTSAAEPWVSRDGRTMYFITSEMGAGSNAITTLMKATR